MYYITLNLFNITIFALVSCTTRTSVYGGITTADHMTAGHTGGCTGLRRMQDRQRVGTNSLSQFRQLRIKPRLEEKTCKFCYFFFIGNCYFLLLLKVGRMCYWVLYVNISQSISSNVKCNSKIREHTVN